ncbi:hypothetical protein N7453_008328 [Penicillium expansum]|nr:hypothetical protein N7453_008328 [Penicillium expansum]
MFAIFLSAANIVDCPKPGLIELLKKFMEFRQCAESNGDVHRMPRRAKYLCVWFNITSLCGRNTPPAYLGDTDGCAGAQVGMIMLMS